MNGGEKMKFEQVVSQFEGVDRVVGALPVPPQLRSHALALDQQIYNAWVSAMREVIATNRAIAARAKEDLARAGVTSPLARMVGNALAMHFEWKYGIYGIKKTTGVGGVGATPPPPPGAFEEIPELY